MKLSRLRIFLSAAMRGNLITSQWVQLFTLILSIFFLVLAIIGTFIYPYFYDKTSIYNITANVEQIVVKIKPGSKANWYLHNAEITYPCYDKKNDNCSLRQEDEYGDLDVLETVIKEFSGSISFNIDGYTDAVITRIGNSDMVIRLSRPQALNNGHKDKQKKLIGDLYSDDEEFLDSVEASLVIKIKDIEKRYENGERIFLNITGDILLADTKDYPDSYIKPLLKNGEVSILEKTFLLNENYLIGPYPLLLGDSIDIHNQHGVAEGFITADSEAGLQVAYRVEAEDGAISRYKFKGYQISPSMLNRLFNDQVLGYLWIIFTIILSLLMSIIDPSTIKSGVNEKD